MIDPREPDYTDTPVSDGRPTYGYESACRDTPPIVSIVTPCYNIEAWYFDETIRCVRRQSFQQFEWILVDDGSTQHDSVLQLERLAGREPRVRLIRQANAGPGAARNRGAREARGQFLLWLDSDDLIEPTYIEKTLWCLLSHTEFDFCNAWPIGFGSEQYLWPRGFERGAETLHENQGDSTTLVRRDVHLKMGGFDESIRVGHEDWDYWLSMASNGFWGWTIPEFMIWYRRREASRIDETDGDPARKREFLAFLRRKHARLYEDKTAFPRRPDPDDMAPEPVPFEIPFANPLANPNQRRRLLFIVPWMSLGGADKFNLDVVAQLRKRDWDITIATTMPSEHEWIPAFARHTPDLFCLDKFLRLVDSPRFLLYLMRSRGITHVLLSNSQLGYELLPMLQSHYPQAAFMDYCHSAPPKWKDGGYPAMGARWTDSLDLHAVSSNQLRHWMAERGAAKDRIEVCTTNIDPDHWRSDKFDRRQVRSRYLDGKDSPDRCIILWCGRFVDDKRPAFLIDLLRRLAETGADFLALLAGDGEHRPHIESVIDQHHLHDKVRLLGSLPNADIERLLAAADVFLLPSAVEGVSLALFEAMAMEVVPVSADVGGQSELVTPDVGFLIAHDAPEAEKRVYLQVLDRLIRDVGLRRRLAAAARRRIVEHFNVELMGQRMHELLLLAEQNHQCRPQVPMPPATAEQYAALCVDRFRLELLSDHLWLQLNRQTSERAGADGGVVPISLARAELGYIENSRSWQAIQRFKRAWPYRVFAYLVHGTSGNTIDPLTDPREKLAAIKRSRFYRLLQAIKRTAIYRAYARRKYGREIINPWS